MDFVLNLTGNLAKAATADADALAKLYAATRAEEAALSKMEKQLKAAGKSGVTNVDTGRALSKSIEEQRKKISDLTDEMVKLGGAGYQPAREESTKLTAGMLTMATAVGGVAAKAFTYLAQQARAAIAQIVAFSEARGDFVRGLESIYGSQEAAEHTYDVISNLTDRVAVSQEKALTIFDRLEKAGVQNGDQTVKATEAIAKAEAARKGAGDALQGVIERAGKSRMFSISRDELRAAGLTYTELAKSISEKTGAGVRDAELALRFGRVKLGDGIDALSAVVNKKLGKIADKKFYTLGNQLTRLGDNIGRIFAGSDTSKLAIGLSKIVALFNENSVAGGALKSVIESTFGVVGELVEKAAPYVELFFLGVELGMLKIYNALYPVRKALAEAFGGDSGAALENFEVLMLGLADAVGIVARVVADLATAAFKVTKAFFDVGFAVGDAIIKITEGDWIGAGYSIGEGLVKGVTSAAGAVIDAVKSVGDGALAAFKGVFQIKSPSRVMAQQGDHINEGLAQGIKRSASLPETAMERSMEGARGPEPVAALPPPQLAPSVAKSDTRTVSIAEGAIVVNVNGGAGSTAETKAAMTEIFVDLFEQIGITMGARA